MENTTTEQPKAVKLPYFHRTLSPEELALIGDTTPKPIAEATNVTIVEPAAGKLASGSAWNSAQTWEERDCTKWALEKLPDFFTEHKELPKAGQYTVLIKDLSNLQGTAQIAHVRGKARFIYELSFDLKFDVSAGDKKYKGKVSVTDVINDQLDDIEFSLSWTKESPPNAEVAAVRSSVIGGSALKKLIKERVAKFEEEFRKL